MRTAIALLAMLAAVGCRSERAGAEGDRAARVGEMLYARNLIADTAVSGKMQEFASSVDGRGVPADSVLAEVHAWLEAWAAAHPDRAERARLMPRPQVAEAVPKKRAQE